MDSQKRLEEIQSESKRVATDLVSFMLKEALTDLPIIKTIMWAQYTPYFNDGDVCRFTVCDVYFVLEECEEFDYEVAETKGFSCWGRELDISEFNKNFQKEVALGLTYEDYTTAKAITKTIHSAENYLEEIFGEHVSVVVNSKGINIQDYDHD